MSEVLEKAISVIAEQQNMIKDIVGASYTFGIVLDFSKRNGLPDVPDAEHFLPSSDNKVNTVILLHNNEIVESVYNDKIGLFSGDSVKCLKTKNGIGIVEKCEPFSFGQTVIIKDVIDKKHAEIEVAGGSIRRIYVGKHKDLEKGCKVILDTSATIVMKNLGKPIGQYNYTASSTVTWDNIGGLENVKKEIADAIENPIKFVELYTAYGRKPTKGILLYGPPGNGKTMIGKAIASSIATLYKTKESGFIYIKGPEILNMYVGVSEERIRAIFSSARDFKKKTGCPAVIFIDEAEAILSKRGSSKSSDVDKTIVPQFLSEMDGLDENAAIVILTTNRPDMLDPAVIREGRIDKKIKVPRPTLESVETIFNLNLKNSPCIMDAKKIAKSAAQLIFDENLCLYNIELESGKQMKFCMSHLVNGAMIATIVNESVSLAINRDLDAGIKVPTGVSLDDISESVTKLFEQNKRMNHQSLFEDLNYELATEDNDKIKEIMHAHKDEKVAMA